MFEILVFSAPWCKACEPYKNMLKNNDINFELIDVEQQPDLARVQHITGLPTTIIRKSAEIIARFNQVVNADEILKVIT